MRDQLPDREAGWSAPGAQTTGICAVTSLRESLAQLAATPLSTLRDDDIAGLLATLTSVADQITAATARVLVEADHRRLGDAEGARHTGHWWARNSRLTRGEAGRRMGLAHRLDTDLHSPVAASMAAGTLRMEQADVICRAVDDLPADLVDDELRTKARNALLEEAAHHDARALRILGKRILDIVAPSVAESHEQRVLEAEEQRAAAGARVTFTDDGHGQVHGRFTLPTLHGELLRSQLLALADPRRPLAAGSAAHDSDNRDEHLPGPVITPERLGHALMEYVERYPAKKLPTHGGGSLGLTITLDLDTLMSGIGAATLSTGQRISAGEARRVACSSGLAPAVLGGKSEVLDLGRSRRLFTASQRKAIEVRDKGCTAEGCGMPSAICHAHHDEPWSRGGKTALSNGRLLCPRHHRLAHDPRYETRAGNGRAVTFHRRT